MGKPTKRPLRIGPYDRRPTVAGNRQRGWPTNTASPPTTCVRSLGHGQPGRRRKLTDQQRQEVARAYREGVASADIMAEYNISRSLLANLHRDVNNGVGRPDMTPPPQFDATKARTARSEHDTSADSQRTGLREDNGGTVVGSGSLIAVRAGGATGLADSSVFFTPTRQP